MRKITLILLLSISANAYGQSMKYVSLTNEKYAPIPHGQVSISADGRSLPKNCKSIGRLVYETKDQAKFLERVKLKASSYGANVVFFIEGKIGESGSVIFARNQEVVEYSKADSLRMNKYDFQVGDKVVLQWKGKFHNVTIIEMQKRNAALIMYDEKDDIARCHIKYLLSRLQPLPKFTIE